ncbi:MAG: hypothetical protein LBL86_08385 [Coriobacteriales bacterium]|jgi:hypothetical protein|nr:hypothetical protein [Coriobacteriales bacterium]
MDYEKIIAEAEAGTDWSDWGDTPSKRVLEDRIIAIRQLAALREQEVQVLHRKQEQLSRMLAVM